MSHKTARQWLETLIAFDTTSAKSNIALIECVASYLESCGVKPLVLHSSDGIHANLLATLPAADGSTTGGLVLSGHSDVVPVAGQKWDSDPFKLTERDGKLYGRGSCDMKGYIAIVLSLVPEWLEKPRSKPLHIALTHSEETNFDGIREMLKEKGTELAKCDGCIIGEPTMLEIVIAHKGICGCAVSVKGKAAHSSLPADGYNAMDAARQVLNGVFDMRDDFEKNGPFDPEFPIPFTSVCPTTINGGNSTNTIPADVSLTFEYRNLPCHDGEEILSRVRRIVAEADAQAKAKCGEASVTLDQVDDAPNFNGDPNAAVVKALQTALNTEAAPLKLGMSTEAGEYEQVGLRAVVCGPGSLEQAHKANEFISVDQFEKGLAVVRKAVDIMCM